MVPGRFSWFLMVPDWFFMVFQGSGWVFMAFHGFTLVFHDSRSVFIVFHGYRLAFHGSGTGTGPSSINILNFF